MATISSNGTGGGNWSSGSSWTGGVAPISVDDAIILGGDTITLDTLTNACTNLTANNGSGSTPGGILTTSTSVSTKLTIEDSALFNGDNNSPRSSNLIIDLSSDPSVSCEIVINNGDFSGGEFRLNGSFQLKGESKTRRTRISGALTANSSTSCIVEDATNWDVGDKLIFSATTFLVTNPLTDIVTIATITPGSGTTATITWTDGTGTGGAVEYDHADGCPVGNYSSNVTFSSTFGNDSSLRCTSSSATQHQESYIENVEFLNLGGSSGFGTTGALTLNGTLSNTTSVSYNTFYNWGRDAVFMRSVESSDLLRTENIFYSEVSNSDVFVGQDVQSSADIGGESNFLLQRWGGNGIVCNYTNQNQSGHWISGGFSTNANSGAIVSPNRSGITVSNCEIWATENGIYSSTLLNVESCSFGDSVRSGFDQNDNYDLRAVIGEQNTINCSFDSSGSIIANFSDNIPETRVKLGNKNEDPNVQEWYGATSETTPLLERDFTTVTNAESSYHFQLNDTRAKGFIFNALINVGETAKFLVYARKGSTYGSSTLPFIRASGLGITPVVATMSGSTASDTWELLELDVENTASADGTFLIELVAQSSTSGAEAWFSGIPAAPFSYRVRHYGFVFNESTPSRVSDIYTVATQSVAESYTGISYNNTTKEITFSAGTGDTFQKMYDHIQSILVNNISYTVPYTRAGNTILLESTTRVIDPLYSGELTWSGGIIQYNSAGTKSDNLDGSLVELDISGGLITFDGSLSGTLDLRNLDASAITVNVPSGTTTTTANNTGGTITVQVAPTTYTLELSNIIDGSRFQIFNVTDNAELANDVVSGGSGIDETFTAGTDYTAGDEGRYRITFQSGTTCKLAIEGSFEFAATTTVNTIPISQQDDSVYSDYAVDGSTVSEFSWDSGNIQVDINDADNTTVVQRIAAWMCYFTTTATGIDEAFGSLSWESINSIRINTSVVDLKLDNTKASPLFLNGGRLYRDDNTTIIASTSNAIQVDYSPVYALETGVSGLTASESTQLFAIGTPGAVADAVWDEPIADHTTSGTTGEALDNAGGGAATPPTEAEIYAYFTALSRADAFKADVSGVASQTSIDALNDFDPATESVTVGILENNTITSSVVANNAFNNSAFTTGYFNAINSEVDSALADYDGPTKAELDAAQTAITNAISALNNLSAAQVNAEVDTALADYDGPTKAELDAAQSSIESAISGLNNLSSSVVAAAVWDYLQSETTVSNSMKDAVEIVLTRSALIPASV